MPKKKKVSGPENVDNTIIIEQGFKRNGGFIPIIVPTQDTRHVTGLRLGKISAEVFCRRPERRRELGLPVLYVEE